MKYFRAVLRRNDLNYDPAGACYFDSGISFHVLDSSYTSPIKIYKFRLIREEFVVFGLIINLDSITEECLCGNEVIIPANDYKCNPPFIKVSLEFKEWSYKKEYFSRKECFNYFVQNTILFSLTFYNNIYLNDDIILTNLFSHEGRYNKPNELTINKDLEDEAFIYFINIFEIEKYYGRKRKKTIINNRSTE